MAINTDEARSGDAAAQAIALRRPETAPLATDITSVPFARPAIGDAEIAAVLKVMQSGWLTTGANAKLFEEKFCELVGGDAEVMAVNSATAGLHLAAEACGIGPGDQVLIPTLTFTATAAVIHYLGADVVLVDVDEDTLTIDLDHAEQLVTPQCKAIMPVHFGGLACNMPAILAFAERHGLKVIDDAAHALPATWDGRIIGSWDTAATVYSFYANKPITTGEGGMLVTRDPEIADRARKMRLHGLDKGAFDRFRNTSRSWEYDVVAAGYKYNMTDLAAAIGVQQLERAEELRRSRELAAEIYLDLLADLPLKLPARAPAGDLHSWHIFPVRLTEEAPLTRDELIATLNEAGIGTSVHYRPLHRMSYWAKAYKNHNSVFPVADRHFEGVVTLPLFSYMTEAEVRRVVDVIKAAVK